MNFELTSDQKMLAETVASFVKQKSTVERFRKLRAAGTPWERDVWAHMGELGWLSVPFPEEVGGFGAGFVEVALILEGLGKALVPEPYLASVVLGGTALLKAGNGTQHEQWLAPMIEGQTSLALAYAERATRHDHREPTTTAKKDAGGWSLTGEKVWVLGGHEAEQLVVSAQTPDGLGLFVVDATNAGVTRQRVRTMDGHGAALVRFTDAKVDDAARLGDPGDAAEAALDHTLDCGAAAAVAEGLGVAQSLHDMTVAHLKERVQFGMPIGAFQVLQHRSVDMFVELELLRSASIMASIRATEEDVALRRRAISAAKATLSHSGRFVAQQAIQLHGGIGITDEHDVGLFFKRMYTLATILGDEQHHTERFATQPSFTA